VQVPGATLPAGTYVFRIANPDVQTVWQVLDANERHVLASFYFVRTGDRTIQEQNHAHGKPVVRFHETPRGIAPPVKVLYYPTDPAVTCSCIRGRRQSTSRRSRTSLFSATDSEPGKEPARSCDDGSTRLRMRRRRPPSVVERSR
jgi:hypothetical protein